MKPCGIGVWRHQKSSIKTITYRNPVLDFKKLGLGSEVRPSGFRFFLCPKDMLSLFLPGVKVNVEWVRVSEAFVIVCSTEHRRSVNAGCHCCHCVTTSRNGSVDTEQIAEHKLHKWSLVSNPNVHFHRSAYHPFPSIITPPQLTVVSR